MKKLLFLLPLLCCLFGCAPKEQTQTGYYFDTVITVTLPAKTDAAVFDGLWSLCEHYDHLFDRFSETGDLARLASGVPITVNSDTAELLSLALQIAPQTDGAFDIRLGAISDLWQFDTQTLPNAQDISSALEEADRTQITVDGTTVTVYGNAKLDLGGIAKGYVTDQLVTYLKENGCDSAILNLGGNVYCLGSKNNRPFTVGIDTLMDRSTPPVLEISNQAAVTAGITQRYMIVDGTRYHHILDPQTGYPAETELLSATVIADSATLADALSTACIVLGKEKAEEMLKRFPDVSAVLVATDGSIFTIQNPPFVQNV